MENERVVKSDQPKHIKIVLSCWDRSGIWPPNTPWNEIKRWPGPNWGPENWLYGNLEKNILGNLDLHEKQVGSGVFACLNSVR